MFAELGVFEPRLEAVGDAAAPREGHTQVGFGFGVRDRVIDLRLDGLSGEVFEARRKGIAERFGHPVDERGIWARGGGDVFSGMPREELTGLGRDRLARVTVFADFGDGG